MYTYEAYFKGNLMDYKETVNIEIGTNYRSKT